MQSITSNEIHSILGDTVLKFWMTELYTLTPNRDHLRKIQLSDLRLRIESVTSH